MREKSKPARNPWRESTRGFGILGRYLYFPPSRHTLSGMRPKQSQVNKLPFVLKVLFQLSQEVEAECLSQRSRRETIVEGSHRSQPIQKQPIDGENLQAWSVAQLDRGHTDCETQKQTREESPATQRVKCGSENFNQWAEAWAHNCTSGGIANHPSVTYTAPGLPSIFSPLSCQSQAITEQISNRLGLQHPPPTNRNRSLLGVCNEVRGCWYGGKEFARGAWGAELTSSLGSLESRLRADLSRDCFFPGVADLAGMPLPGFCEVTKTAEIRRD